MATPAVDDKSVYLSTGVAGSAVHALEWRTGRKSRSYGTQDNGPWSPLVIGDRVITTTESCTLYTFTKTGRTVFKKWLGDPILSTPASDGNQLYVSGNALPAPRGQRKPEGYSVGSMDLRDGRFLWVCTVGQDVLGTLGVSGNSVIFTTQTGDLWCVDRRSGQKRWQRPIRAGSLPAMDGEGVYVSVWEGQKLFKVDAKDGRTLWVADLAEHPITVEEQKVASRTVALPAERRFSYGYWASSPALLNGKVIVGNTKGGISALDCQTGLPSWDAELVSGVSYSGDSPVIGSPAPVGGRVYVGTREGILWCLDVESGQVLWKTSLGHPLIAAPAVAYGRIFALSEAGKLFCVDAATPTADGWTMLGGGPTRSGKPERTVVFTKD